jgi:hypothetical protein
LPHGVFSAPMQTQPRFHLSAFTQFCRMEPAANTDNSLDEKFDTKRQICNCD